jgi:hypothetical protein
MQHPTDDLALSIIPGEFSEFTIYSADYITREIADMVLDRSHALEGTDEGFEDDFEEPEHFAGVLGYMQTYRADAKHWYVTRVVANEGYGPLLYAIAAEHARSKGAILIPSDSLSNAARRVWDRFDRNPYVTIVEDGNSPTGIGITGNGTLDLGAAIAADERVKQAASDDYGMIVGSARDWCEISMDSLWDNDEEAYSPAP